MLRLADVLAGLSVVTDLGMGHAPEQAMRACRIAAALAEDLGLPDAERSDVFYTALLQHLGCTGHAHETAAVWGDDVALNAAGSKTNLSDPRDLFRTFLPELSRGPLHTVRLAAIAILRGPRFGRANNTANCEAARITARRLGLSPGVQEGLYQSFELWSGKGVPRGLAGEEISVAARVGQVAADAALFADLGGPDAVAAALRARARTNLDPRMCERLERLAPELLPRLAEEDPVAGALEAEPGPHVTVPPEALDGVARAFGDLVDLKTPFTHGHAVGVADLALAAGRELGVEDPAALHRAALLHDVGRAAVSSGIWERPGPLGALEWEQVRLHAYHTERVLARSATLAPLAPIAGMHHERLDGSGYHRGADRRAVPMAARILAAADAFQAMTQARAHRPARSPEQAATEVRTEADAARLDPDAVEAVVRAAAVDRGRRPRRPAGLSERQVEVLRLVAQGLSNREIAERLYISPRTAEHHVQDAYTKIGVSSRAAATLFVMEHDLLA